MPQATRGQRAAARTLDFDRRQLGWYLRNVFKSPVCARFRDELLDRSRELAFPGLEGSDPEEVAKLPTATRRLFSSCESVRLAALSQTLETFANYPADEDPIGANFGGAVESFGLDRIEAGILHLLVDYRQNRELEDFADGLLKRLRNPALVLAVLVGEPLEAVTERLQPGARLVSAGVIAVDPDGGNSDLAGRGGVFQASRAMLRAVHQPISSQRDWANVVFGAPERAKLDWEDFTHLGRMRDLARNLLAGATGELGVNILLYGEAGVGKTEFARVLAAELGLPIWSVGEADEEGSEPSRQERLAALRMAQTLLAGPRRTLILFDEAQDLFEGDSDGFGLRHVGSKAFLNRQLERNQIPTLWTCNSLARVDPAVLRRMSLVLEVRAPDSKVRARVWRKAASDNGVDIDGEDIDRLARDWPASPGLIAGAVRAARLSKGGAAAAEAALESSLMALGLSPAPATGPGQFDPGLASCSQGLEALAEGLARAEAPRNWSLCLSGPPGTGKSHYARYVAGRLGLEVVQRRASDLLSKWVGASERNIAAAFAEARDQGALLIFDEADSLLSDRAHALRNWEVSQVNEMLTWMETHPLPFICTTNLAERLDKASLRRFTFKLTFGTLDRTMAARAFERFFGELAPAPLPDGLTPGDFAVVRRKRALLGGEDVALVDWLKEELDSRGARRAPIGFGRRGVTG